MPKAYVSNKNLRLGNLTITEILSTDKHLNVVCVCVHVQCVYMCGIVYVCGMCVMCVWCMYACMCVVYVTW